MIPMNLYQLLNRGETMKSIELESSVLSCMILDERCSKDCNILSKEDFTHPTNINIFEAIKLLVQKNKAVDYLTVYHELNKAVTITYLSDLANSMATTANFREYVKELKDLTLKRQLAKLGQALNDRNKSGKELAELAEREIFALSEKLSFGEFVNIKDIVLDVYLDIDKRYQNTRLEGITTGYQGLDKVTDGLKKKNLIYLAGRPSMGKTALALNIAEKNILVGNSVAIFSLEMGKEELVKRLILSMSYVSAEKLKNKELTEEDWARMLKGANALLDKKLFIEDNASLTVPEMTSMCRRLKKDNKLELIIIDYLQLINSNGEKKSRREEIDYISKNLKAMAKELDVPVLVISSLSRATEQRQNKRPMLSDLRESGQIEYDADLVLFVHREEYYNPTDENRGEAEIIVAKQRNGQLGIVKLRWLGHCTKFIDASHIVKGR